MTVTGAIGNDGASTGGLVVSQETGEDGTLVLAGENTYSGGTTVDSGVTLSVSDNSALGTGGVTLDSSATLALTGSSLTLTGAFSQDAGSTTTIATRDSLTLNGTASLSGTTSGTGTLALAGGSVTIGSGATVTAPTWSISGAGTDVTLDENLSYKGSFSEGAGDTFVLSGGNLLLNGADTFSGGTVDGSNSLETEGTTKVSGLTIGGTAEWENTTTVTQSGGTGTIDDATGVEPFLDNMSTGTYDIADNSGITLGSSTASFIVNAGLLEKMGGTSTSVIAPAVTNTGTLEVTAGTLDFQGAVTGTGTDTISGASTLEFDSAVSSSTTVGSQNIRFTGGTLDLTDPTSFYGEVSGFAAGDTVELLGSWAFSGFSENSGGTLATLTLVNGTTTHAFDFVGDYAQGDFKITSGATSTITHT